MSIPPVKGVAYRKEKRFWLIASRKYRPALFENFFEDDSLNPAKAYVQQVVNKHMENRITSRLLWETENPEKLHLHMVPKNLIGALWLQFARAIDSDKDFRRCLMCNKFMEISLENTGSRIDRKTCSDTCRAKLYRQTRKVIDLKKQGYSVNRISQSLKTDEGRIKQLIAERQKLGKSANRYKS